MNVWKTYDYSLMKTDDATLEMTVYTKLAQIHLLVLEYQSEEVLMQAWWRRTFWLVFDGVLCYIFVHWALWSEAESQIKEAVAWWGYRIRMKLWVHAEQHWQLAVQQPNQCLESPHKGIDLPLPSHYLKAKNWSLQYFTTTTLTLPSAAMISSAATAPTSKTNP